jgi:xanthine dehydrogenase YagR molybdenum-binding subunit
MEDPNSPLHGLAADEIVADGGCLCARRGSVSYADILRSRKLDKIEAEANVAPGAETERFAIHSFGAQFSEVRVDADPVEVRVTKHIGVFDIGRVIHAKTARSQALGGITMGIGMALLEHTVLRPAARLSRYQ